MPQFENISLRKAYVSGEPELVTITPKSGEHKDQEVDVVKFNIAHSTWQPDPNDAELSGSETGGGDRHRNFAGAGLHYYVGVRAISSLFK